MRIITYTLIFIAIVFGLTFAILNPASTTVHYYIGTATLPLSVLLLLTLTLGWLLGIISMSFSCLRLKKDIIVLRHQLKSLENEQSK